MVQIPLEFTRLLLQIAAGLIVLAGATIDLLLAFLLQRRRTPLVLAAQDFLLRSPLALACAPPVLFVTLLFAVPTLFQEPNAPLPSEATLILGPVLYALTGLVVVAFGVYVSNTTFREAFISKNCSTAQALRKGVLYGFAVIPPVMLLSYLMGLFASELGYEPRPQEVFDWLNAGTLSTGTRLFLMFAATVIAPVVEETLFRGILFPALLKNRTFLSSALLTAAYFSLVHFHAPSFLPLLALSLGFSAAYAATGSLLTPIVMHALFNATSILLYLIDTV
jgi:membrane protease YdiL (CAAX protease family)